MASAQATKGLSGSRGRGGARRIRESLVRGLTLLCAAVSIATTFGIVYTLIFEAFSFFREVPVGDFLTGTEWLPQSNPAKFGVLPLLGGTLMITVGAAFIAVPLGLLTAIYLSEYASQSVRKVVKPALELLAGIPTVVYGYLALFLITPIIRQLTGGNVSFLNAAAGAVVVGIMTLPLVSSLCEDALSSVPRALREGAYGLGSTKAEVTLKIVVPAALSGIVASFILAVSRAVGETMAVTLAAGSTPNLTLNPLEPIQTMTAYIVQTSSGDTARGSVQYQTIFAVGLTLFVMTLALNLLAQKLVRKYQRVDQ